MCPFLSMYEAEPVAQDTAILQEAQDHGCKGKENPGHGSSLQALE